MSTNAERFAKYVDRADESGCWTWTACVDKRTGYGIFVWKRDGKPWTRTAHRSAYELAHGPIPEGKMVLHTCDVRTCVRPDHLYLGTHADNMQDKVERNRCATGLRNGKHTKPECQPRGDNHHARRNPEALARGTDHGCCKYTPEIVIAVRERRAAGKKLREISEEFSIPIPTVYQMTTRDTWRHI